MVYWISAWQTGHRARAGAQDGQVTMWAHGRNTMLTSAPLHTLHMGRFLIVKAAGCLTGEIFIED